MKASFLIQLEIVESSSIQSRSILYKSVDMGSYFLRNFLLLSFDLRLKKDDYNHMRMTDYYLCNQCNK